MPRPLRLLAFALVALGFALAGSPPHARAATSAVPTVVVIKVQGVIDPALSDDVKGSIERAEREGATVILQVDSRGSYGDLGLRLGEFVDAVRVPVVAWVGPLGARVEGGALFLTYGSALQAIAPGAGIGPARPFDLGTKASAETPAEVARNSAALQGLAEGTGVPPAVLTSMVRGAALPAGPALRSGAVGIVAASIPDLLQRLDGRTVVTPSGPVTLATANRPDRPVDVQFEQIGLWRRILHAVSTPTAVYVLLLIGLWGIAFEFTQPGLGIAGIAGGVSLAFAVYGLTVVPVHWLGLALIVLGVAAQAMDVVVRRVGVLTAVGTALFLVGSLLAWRGVAPAVDLSLWLVILATVAGFLLFGFGMTVALQARERVRTAQVGLVGLVGESRSDLDPEGGVFVKGALWRARSMNGPIPSGRRVRVRGIDGLILRVEEEPTDPST